MGNQATIRKCRLPSPPAIPFSGGGRLFFAAGWRGRAMGELATIHAPTGHRITAQGATLGIPGKTDPRSEGTPPNLRVSDIAPPPLCGVFSIPQRQRNLARCFPAGRCDPCSTQNLAPLCLFHASMAPAPKRSWPRDVCRRRQIQPPLCGNTTITHPFRLQHPNFHHGSVRHHDSSLFFDWASGPSHR